METSIDFSALFIATDTPGKFQIIPNLAFQYKDIPLAEFGLKLVYPGYLGILNCKYRFCYALAPVDNMPTVKNVHEEAQKLGFKGDFNRSYLLEEQMTPHLSIFEDDDIDRDPEELYDEDGED
ncbi:uncharacterized protein LOC119835620 [Zerene cesonia]|uniref:uncharacterized protein LOC119835620 n=1 Tax=Zerene cesonia TaxID=33412 RepID=UPI0018E51ACC|nr:uncharacterized protein LOC119835620 [Zerene cesonia]